MTDNTDIITTGTALLTALNASGITGPAETINDLWKAIFGYPAHYFSERRRIEYEAKLQKFEQEIVTKVINLKEAHKTIQEPKISIIGPALEAAKYYFDEDEIREMFSNLISSSMDPDNNEDLHHSYVEIIKQLSPNDAKVFKSFSSMGSAVAKIRIEDSTGIGNDLIPIFYISSGLDDITRNAISISNLSRLGLVEIQDSFFTNQEFYEPIKKHPIFLGMREKFKEAKNMQVKMHPQVIKITPLGLAFKRVCLDN